MTEIQNPKPSNHLRKRETPVHLTPQRISFSREGLCHNSSSRPSPAKRDASRDPESRIKVSAFVFLFPDT
jgi:hypothetical protein